VGQAADLAIDSPRREKIRKSHTGTHVLHWALREVLGSHAHQAGSLVESGRLRFDFSHFSPVAPTEVAEIESLANRRLIENGHVTTTITTKQEAESEGALAFFGDKYGETVRVVRIGRFSAELCGGTHTHTAAQVGPLIVLGESSIGSNIRRIEALTGENAYQQITGWRSAIDDTARILRAAPGEVPDRVRSLLSRIDEMEDHLDSYRQRDRTAAASELAAKAEQIGSAKLLVAHWPNVNAEQLRLLALAARDKFARGMVVLGSSVGGKGSLVGVATKDLVTEGFSAAEVVAAGARLLGGGGSRDPELAQAGGPHGDQLDAALAAAHELAAARLHEL
jgi:alanyl-tRNA synthetase